LLYPIVVINCKDRMCICVRILSLSRDDAMLSSTSKPIPVSVDSLTLTISLIMVIIATESILFYKLFSLSNLKSSTYSIYIVYILKEIQGLPQGLKTCFIYYIGTSMKAKTAYIHEKPKVASVFLMNKACATVIIPSHIAKKHGISSPSNVIVEDTEKGILIRKVDLKRCEMREIKRG
jgi:hypothetical protein